MNDGLLRPCNSFKPLPYHRVNNESCRAQATGVLEDATDTAFRIRECRVVCETKRVANHREARVGARRKKKKKKKNSTGLVGVFQIPRPRSRRTLSPNSCRNPCRSVWELVLRSAKCFRLGSAHSEYDGNGK